MIRDRRGQRVQQDLRYPGPQGQGSSRPQGSVAGAEVRRTQGDPGPQGPEGPAGGGTTEPPGTQRPQDYDALAALYNATDGPNWTNNTGWLSDRPLEEWYGVSVNAEGRVDSLSLVGNNLTGSIPPELGSLSNLEYLLLVRNQLTGPIPAELGSLSNLEHLSLFLNQLTGPIPAELGSLSKLTELSLERNVLTGPIPADWTPEHPKSCGFTSTS